MWNDIQDHVSETPINLSGSDKLLGKTTPIKSKDRIVILNDGSILWKKIQYFNFDSNKGDAQIKETSAKGVNGI